MTIFNCITQKLVASQDSKLITIKSVNSELERIIAEGFEGRIYYHESLDTEELKAAIKSLLEPLQDSVQVRIGAANGCYGSSTGATEVGLDYATVRKIRGRE